jgi:hypothetical protein
VPACSVVNGFAPRYRGGGMTARSCMPVMSL